MHYCPCFFKNHQLLFQFSMQCELIFTYLCLDNYEKIAEGVVVNRIRSSWIELYKLYNDQAAEKGVSLSMAFVLLTINENFGTPVTKNCTKDEYGTK